MNTLNYISFFSILIPIGFCLTQWEKLPSAWSALRWLLVFSLLADVLGYLAGWLFKNSFPVFNLFSLIQFSVIAYIFSGFYKAKRVVSVVYIIYIIYFIIDVIFFESPFRILTNATVLATLLLIILLLYYLSQKLIDSSVTLLHYEPVFWIAFALLMYFSGSLFVTLAYNQVIDLNAMNKITWNVWDIHNICNISKNILLAVALWLNYRSVKFTA